MRLSPETPGKIGSASAGGNKLVGERWRSLLSSWPSVGPRVRLIHEIRKLEELAEDWQALADDSAPMQQFIWSRVAAEVFDARARLNVLAVAQGDRLRAIAPLVLRGRILPRWELIGAAELSEPSDLIYRDQEGLCELLAVLARRAVPLYIPRVFADSRLIEAIRGAYRRRGMVIVRPAPGCPRIPLDDSWREPERKVSPTRRSDLRRRGRIAESIGPVQYETVVPEANQLPALLEEAYRVEESSWKGREGSALAQDRSLGVFFRKYAGAARDKGILRLYFMRIGGRAVAMQIAVECGDSFWGLKIGYDEQFKRCAPGLLLTLHTLRDAAARGLRSYEFLGAASPWTYEWTKEVRPCVSVRAYPARPTAMLRLAVDGLQWARERLRAGNANGAA
jgi:CelD/BcsL family acetyltransferase involved in cellulose biosynthesis